MVAPRALVHCSVPPSSRRFAVTPLARQRCCEHRRKPSITSWRRTGSDDAKFCECNPLQSTRVQWTLAGVYRRVQRMNTARAAWKVSTRWLVLTFLLLCAPTYGQQAHERAEGGSTQWPIPSSDEIRK